MADGTIWDQVWGLRAPSTGTRHWGGPEDRIELFSQGYLWNGAEVSVETSLRRPAPYPGWVAHAPFFAVRTASGIERPSPIEFPFVLAVTEDEVEVPVGGRSVPFTRLRCRGATQLTGRLGHRWIVVQGVRLGARVPRLVDVSGSEIVRAARTEIDERGPLPMRDATRWRERRARERADAASAGSAFAVRADWVDASQITVRTAHGPSTRCVSASTTRRSWVIVETSIGPETGDDAMRRATTVLNASFSPRKRRRPPFEIVLRRDTVTLPVDGRPVAFDRIWSHAAASCVATVAGRRVVIDTRHRSLRGLELVTLPAEEVRRLALGALRDDED